MDSRIEYVVAMSKSPHYISARMFETLRYDNVVALRSYLGLTTQLTRTVPPHYVADASVYTQEYPYRTLVTPIEQAFKLICAVFYEEIWTKNTFSLRFVITPGSLFGHPTRFSILEENMEDMVGRILPVVNANDIAISIVAMYESSTGGQWMEHVLSVVAPVLDLSPDSSYYIDAETSFHTYMPVVRGQLKPTVLLYMLKALLPHAMLTYAKKQDE